MQKANYSKFDLMGLSPSVVRGIEKQMAKSKKRLDHLEAQNSALESAEDYFRGESVRGIKNQIAIPKKQIRMETSEEAKPLALGEESESFLPKIGRGVLNTSRADGGLLPEIPSRLLKNGSSKELHSPGGESITKRLKQTLMMKRNSDVKAVGHKIDELAQQQLKLRDQFASNQTALTDRPSALDLIRRERNMSTEIEPKRLGGRKRSIRMETRDQRLQAMADLFGPVEEISAKQALKTIDDRDTTKLFPRGQSLALPSNLKMPPPLEEEKFGRKKSELYKDKSLKMSENPLLNFGLHYNWSVKERYPRFRSNRPHLGRPSVPQSRNEESPSSPDVLPSLHSLNNRHISDYVQAKTDARSALLKEGKMEPHQFMNPYPNYQQQSKRPTALSIFPHVGMISKERNYETQKKRSEFGVEENPLGIDEVNLLKFYNHTNNEIKSYKNESIRVKDMLIKRKYVSKKGEGKK